MQLDSGSLVACCRPVCQVSCSYASTNIAHIKQSPT